MHGVKRALVLVIRDAITVLVARFPTTLVRSLRAAIVLRKTRFFRTYIHSIWNAIAILILSLTST
jgi:hypothetical protein